MASYLSSFTPSTDRQILVRGGSGDDDFLYRALQVGLGLGRVGEMSGRFNHDLDTGRGPVQLRGIAFGVDLELLAVDGDEIVAEVMVLFRLPRIESYLSRCASVAGLVRSLTAAISMSLLPSDA